jgi:hypothetical protein
MLGNNKGISLYSYLNSNWQKCHAFLIVFYVFLQQNQRTRGQNRFCSKMGEVAQIIYTHVSKCKNDKIKIFKNSHK